MECLCADALRTIKKMGENMAEQNAVAPLVPADVDLRDFPFTPLFRSKLFNSEFHALATDTEWRCGVTLWLKSWDQIPSGTLPTDDVTLCRLAELGRDLKKWQRIKGGALRGWMLCSDGRLHHRVVAESVLEAWKRKLTQRAKTISARAALATKRAETGRIGTVQKNAARSVTDIGTDSVTDPVTDSVTDPVTDIGTDSVSNIVTESVTNSKWTVREETRVQEETFAGSNSSYEESNRYPYDESNRHYGDITTHGCLRTRAPNGCTKITPQLSDETIEFTRITGEVLP